jgi:hypothetical protein
MKLKSNLTPYAQAVAFFHEHAGWSYTPGKETEAQGRMRCARSLAKAESVARNVGLSFDWEQDECDSSEWSDERPAWAQWVCACRGQDGKILDSLGAIDFGRDGQPWGQPYKRVVEAELATMAIDQLEGGAP